MHSAVYFLTEKEIIRNKFAVSAIGVTTFALLTWLGAYIYIPLGFTPVPITLQEMFVFLSGALLGRRLGPASQITYLCAGAMGLPIFSASGFGLSHIAGPTGGYLLGFVFSSCFIGYALRKNTSTLSMLAAFSCGAVIIYALGTAWLVLGLRLGLKQAVALGVIPFMPGCFIKIALATLIAKKSLKHAGRIFS
ncbi:MAG: biotin transporter BioY [Candidatus Omnitrophica bacterium]|jgi:biotin transport system substrate-specific component|nr:biotin transporter BioY [Candidatus Omnitrophota bacterium]